MPALFIFISLFVGLVNHGCGCSYSYRDWRNPSPISDICIRWTPGYWKHTPWTAFLNLVGFVLCCAVLAAVLWTSDGKDINDWPKPSHTISVSVLLALIVGIANLCLSVALAKGYEISWWLSALKGAELRRLQFDLEVQHHLYALVGKTRAFNQFAIAAVTSIAVSILDGPLIQRASTISTTTYQPVEIEARVDVTNGLLPANFSSYVGSRGGTDLLMPVFRDVSRAYANRDDIRLSLDDCKTNTTCTFRLPAAGFDFGCTEQRLGYDFDRIFDVGSNREMTVFNTTLKFGGSYGNITITSLLKPDAECAGQFVKRTCDFRLATVEYPVTITDGVATLENWHLGQNETLETTTWQNGGYDTLWTGSMGSGGGQTMLGGVFDTLESLYSSSVLLYTSVMTSVPYLLVIKGQSASNYLTSDFSTYSNCTMTWDDPTTDLINTARELMFRSAIAYSDYNRSAVVPQELKIRQTKVGSAYHSHYNFFGITIACMALQGLLVSYMLCGWHRLGREVSLDAFEIARAMRAPLLQDESSNSRIDEALLQLQHTKFRYGELVPENSETWASRDQSQRDGNEAISHELLQYDSLEEGQMGNPGSGQKPRLGLDRAEHVRTIRLGVPY
ncbi:hypothetical protein PG984_013879 [Apiospora sp. TS-2023a]